MDEDMNTPVDVYSTDCLI